MGKRGDRSEWTDHSLVERVLLAPFVVLIVCIFYQPALVVLVLSAVIAVALWHPQQSIEAGREFYGVLADVGWTVVTFPHWPEVVTFVVLFTVLSFLLIEARRRGGSDG